MNVIDRLAQLLAESEHGKRLGRAIESANAAKAQTADQQRVARRRRLIVDALGIQGLTASDGEKLLSWAEPGTLTGDEALALLKVLRTAAMNPRRGKGLLKDESGHLTLARKVDLWLGHISLLHGTETPPRRRLQEIRRTTWWPEVVEAMYRAELTSCKHGDPLHHTPSEAAEDRVGRAVGISAASIHAICHQVRKGRGGEAPIEPIPVQRFEQWLSGTGELFDERG